MAKDRRKKILKAVESMIANRRFHEVTLDEVARKAGVGKGTIYRYFENKDDLFIQLAADGFTDLCEIIHREKTGTDDFDARLLRVIRALSDFIQTRRPLMRIIREEEDRDSTLLKRVHGQRQERKQMLHAELKCLLEDGLRDGHIRGDIDLEYQAVCLMSLLKGRMHYHCLHGEAPPLEDLVTVFLRGVGREG